MKRLVGLVLILGSVVWAQNHWQMQWNTGVGRFFALTVGPQAQYQTGPLRLKVFGEYGFSFFHVVAGGGAGLDYSLFEADRGWFAASGLSFYRSKELVSWKLEGDWIPNIHVGLGYKKIWKESPYFGTVQLGPEFLLSHEVYILPHLQFSVGRSW
jgi:hypothetical protein